MARIPADATIGPAIGPSIHRPKAGAPGHPQIHELRVDGEDRQFAAGLFVDLVPSSYLEAHERWEYDDARSVQILRRLVCLCTACQGATHYGLATLRGRDGEATARLRAVTGLSTSEIRRHIESAYRTWERRSRRLWTLDLSILTGAGIGLNEPPSSAEERDNAVQELG